MTCRAHPSCPCPAYSEARRTREWDVCGCGHTKQTHGEVKK